MRATFSWWCWKHGNSTKGEYEPCKDWVPHTYDDCKTTQVIVMEVTTDES